jgi:hypothetical protein
MLRAPRFGGWLYTEHLMRPRRLALLSILAALALIATAGGGAAAARSGQAGLAAAGGIEAMPIFGARARPRPQKSPNLLSHGGPIQASPKVYISYWGPEWTNGFGSGSTSSASAQAYVNGFFDSVGGSAWNNVVTQYCTTSSGNTTCPSGAVHISNPDVFDNTSAYVWNDPTAVPSKPTQSNIAAAALRLVAATTGTIDPNATYFVFTPSGKSMSGFKTTWCAWHSSGTSGGQSFAYAYMPYIPDAGASCGMSSVNAGSAGYFDGFSIVGGHEFSEAETDPFPSSGWTDSSGSENADKCAWTGMINISLGG